MISEELDKRLSRISFVKVTALYALLSCSLNVSNYIGKLEINHEIPISEIQSYANDILPAKKGGISIAALKISPHDKTTVSLTISGAYRSGGSSLPFDASATSGLSYSSRTHTLSLSGVHLQNAMLGGMTYKGMPNESAKVASDTLPSGGFEGAPVYLMPEKSPRDWICRYIPAQVTIKGGSLSVHQKASPYLALGSSALSMVIFILSSLCIALVIWSKHPPAFALWAIGANRYRNKFKP